MKKAKAVIIAILLVGLVIGILGYASSLREVHSSKLIDSLESVEAGDYSEIKAELAKSLLENKGVEAEKVVFYINAPHCAPYYRLEIYYKVDNTWYRTSKSWLSSWISHEVDNEVCNMILS